VVKGLEGGRVEGLDAAPLGRGEVVGNREDGELLDRSADLLKLTLQLERPRRDGADHWRGALHARRIAQKLAPVRLVRTAVELYQLRQLGRGQTVSIGALEQPLLVLEAQIAQRFRDGRSDLPLRQLLLRRRRQA
jgi:hypothetical protein